MAEDRVRASSLASNLGPLVATGGLTVPLQLLPFLNDHSNLFTENPTNPVAQSPAVDAAFTYTLKIHNPASAGTGQEVSKFIIREMHDFHGRFEDLDHLKTTVCSIFKADIPVPCEIGSIGYFEGRQKRWLCDDRDCEVMYQKFKGTSQISLWCERVAAKETQELSGTKRPATTKRDRHEEEVNDIFEDLRKKHKDMETPKLRLWARMISNGLHESTDEPPNVPMITGKAAKQPKRDSMHDTVVDAAKAVAEVLTGLRQKDDHSKVPTSQASTTGVSPLRLADIRMKHYEQLRYLHTLFDDGILTEQEFLEQKGTILDTLRCL